MNTATTRRIAQTTAEDLHRLADQAERKGVRLLVDHRTGQHVATSASDPTRCYHVDPERGCTCKGYTAWNRCMHHSLLLAELGRLPEVEPVVTDMVIVEAPAPCRSCRGEGWIRMSTGAGLADWVAVECRCRAGSRAIALAA
ncbi:MAG: hypothetical protein M3Q71_08340 [Chloroflexota bacterium]|nr:hypothetical protein [Chloroflexota bacterium]